MNDPRRVTMAQAGRRLRICHVFPWFSIKFAGGTSDFMFKIAKAQLKAGHEVVIYSGAYRFDQELAASLPEAIFRVVPSYLDGAGFSIMPDLPALASREVPTFDVVHMHVFRTFQNVVLYRACRRSGVPYVVDAHGAVPYYRRKRTLKRLFDRIWGRRMLRDAACILAETEVGVAEYLEIDPALDRSRITVLSPPFDTEPFSRLPARGAFRQQQGIGDDEALILFLGRIHHIKGNDFLIRGFAELLRRGRNSRLVLVGPDGGHEQECRRLAAELGIAERVLFAGFLSGNAKLSALVDADIVAQMSRQEQGAWAPIEAVLCGTPIIVSAHTGAGEDVRRLDAGWTADFDDVPGLADQLGYILDHRDEARVRTLRAKAHIERSLSFDTRVNEYTNLYTGRCNGVIAGGEAGG
jgi:glycosyltransferase involved in cell wall biosynthesis